MGQLAICPPNLQNVTEIVKRNLTVYDLDFTGWSGLLRRTCAIYSLPDPLQYFDHPWDPKRWRTYVKEVVTEYWDNILKANAEGSDTLNLMDLSRLSTSEVHPLWKHAGLNSLNVKKTTIVFWLLLDVFHTNSKLFLFGKRKSEQCDLCGAPKEDRIHFGLVCPSLHIIRNDFLLQIVSLSPCIIPYLEPTETLLVAILDPESPILPGDLIESPWVPGMG